MGVKKLNTKTIKLITVYALRIYEHKLLIFGFTYLLTFISLLRTFFLLSLSLGLYIEPFFYDKTCGWNENSSFMGLVWNKYIKNERDFRIGGKPTRIISFFSFFH